MDDPPQYGLPTIRYTPADMDHMRRSLRRVWMADNNGGPYMESELAALIEQQLVTYLGYGTTAGELEEHALQRERDHARRLREANEHQRAREAACESHTFSKKPINGFIRCTKCGKVKL